MRQNWFLASILLLAGCPGSNSPVIESFTASSTSVAGGATVMLTWSVKDANEIQINAQPGGLVTTSQELSGSVQSAPLDRTTAFVLTAVGDDEAKSQSVVVVQVTGGKVSITSFTASPEALPLGDSSELAWTVSGATSVRITDSGGTAVFDGTQLTGTQTVTPNETTAYTLTASDGATSETATLVVTVNPPGSARIVSFTATPPAVSLGQQSALEWSVEDAPEGIEIRTNGATVFTSSAATGSFSVRPLETTDYTLVALNPIGDARDTVTVTVGPGAPYIVSFEIIPNPAALGQTARAEWTVVGAETIRLLIDGEVVLEVPADMDPGFTEGTIDQMQSVFTLEAVNAQGTTMQSITLLADSAPIISFFRSDVIALAEPDDVHLAWDVLGATWVTLTANGVVVPAASGVFTGTATVAISETTIFELTATNAYGETRSAITVAFVQGEVEPNNSPLTAQVLVGLTSAVSGSLDPQDQDYFAIDVPVGGWVRARLFSEPCAQFQLSLLDRDGQTIRANGQPSEEACTDIDPRFNGQARNLAGGRYYILVGSFAPTDYVLLLEAGPAACGNAIFELGELCDDANRTPGDGCSSTCSIEPLGTVSGPPGDMTFTGTFEDPAPHVYQVSMQNDGFIRAETFVPASPTCTGDTLLGVFSLDGAQLAFDDDGGIAPCSRVVYQATAGEYLIVVQAMLPLDYTVRIEALEPGCGNSVPEVGEGCDDGNTISGDGCSATCTFEGPSETEPNDMFDSTGVITASIAAVYSGGIPGGDVDVWGIEVQEGYSISVQLLFNGSPQCPTTPPTWSLTLLDTDGVTPLFTGINAGNNCPEINPAERPAAAGLPAGTYYVAVETSPPGGMIPSYQISLDTIAPGCPNGIREGSETCDDGNTTAGDGCDATCQVETEGTFGLPAGSPIVISGAITPASDTDVFRINVAAGGDVLLTAQTFVPNQGAGCTPDMGDTVLTVFDSTFSEIAENDDSMPGLCSRVSGVLLAGGSTYFVRVRAYNLQVGTIASYELVFDSDPANVCGNGLAESTNNEQCDDGDTTAGDGCSAACTYEIGRTFNPPGGTNTLAIAAAPGSFNTARVNLTQLGQSITATVTVAGNCPAGATMTLLDAGFSPLGGSANCRFNFPGPGFSYDLPAGTYYIRVDPMLAGAGTVSIAVGIRNAVCGDGYVQESTGETCDDGNTTAGDGCDASCQFEGNVVPESEVNNNQSTADATGLFGAGTAIVVGEIAPSGDDDVYSFTVPPNTTVVFRARTHSVLFDELTCDNFMTDTRIFLEQAGVEAFDENTGELAYSDDITASVFCSEVSGVQLQGGPGSAGTTYYVRVQSFGDQGERSYFMTIELQ